MLRRAWGFARLLPSIGEQSRAQPSPASEDKLRQITKFPCTDLDDVAGKTVSLDLCVLVEGGEAKLVEIVTELDDVERLDLLTELSILVALELLRELKELVTVAAKILEVRLDLRGGDGLGVDLNLASITRRVILIVSGISGHCEKHAEETDGDGSSEGVRFSPGQPSKAFTSCHGGIVNLRGGCVGRFDEALALKQGRLVLVVRRKGIVGGGNEGLVLDIVVVLHAERERPVANWRLANPGDTSKRGGAEGISRSDARYCKQSFPHCDL